MKRANDRLDLPVLIRFNFDLFLCIQIIYEEGQ